jgi:serine/threonine protein kinase
MLWSRAIVREFAMVRRFSPSHIGISVFLSFIFTPLFLLGDIKCENVLVTSWNWLYLTDFASFKPTYIPDDDPSDFSFFFDTGGRRRCYLAPEVSPFAKVTVKKSYSLSSIVSQFACSPLYFYAISLTAYNFSGTCSICTVKIY